MANILLIHGSWHGAWCWRSLTPLLRDAGHAVWAPTLSGCAERFHHHAGDVTTQTHIRDVIDLIEFEDIRDVMLLGHSSAGMLMPGIANATAGRLSGCIYLDAYLVPAGRCGFDLWPADRAAAARAAINAGDPFRAPVAPQALGIEDPDLAAWVSARLRPHPLLTYEGAAPAESAAASRLPRLYIHCSSGPLAGVFASALADARAAGWATCTIDAGHDAMLTHPVELADLIARWAHNPVSGNGHQMKLKGAEA